MPLPFSEFNAERFQSHIGEMFGWQPSLSGPEFRMRLLEVERFRQQPGLTREPFSLLFVLYGEPSLRTGLHNLVHPDFEQCELLISRVTVPKHERDEPAGKFYEAVFS